MEWKWTELYWWRDGSIVLCAAYCGLWIFCVISIFLIKNANIFNSLPQFMINRGWFKGSCICCIHLSYRFILLKFWGCRQANELNIHIYYSHCGLFYGNILCIRNEFYFLIHSYILFILCTYLHTHIRLFF